jgi:putative acyl-CoA dehydrogenase
VENQPPLQGDFNACADDPLLARWLQEAPWRSVAAKAHALGEYVGSVEARHLAADANRFPPQLRTHDRYGRRIDHVDYHPAYHALVGTAARHGVHGHAWQQGGSFSTRAVLVYLWNQLENGTACPLTMTFAGVRVLRHAPDALAKIWQPRLTAADYDPRGLPVAQKRAAQVGMAMTEKQGGSDLRAVSTLATPTEGGWVRLNGHKWFCSAPMSDGFFTLARLPQGVSCFLVPRWLPDGTLNAFRIQRLKEKCGNRSNASSEIEYHGTLAHPVGEPGRGIATLIEMAHLTRFDIVLALAGMMRGGYREVLHHTEHRAAFGRPLCAQPAMRSVLLDLGMEWRAATRLAFRLARAFDDESMPEERLLARVLTPIAKYWLSKRMVPFAFEAMECLGGSGYVEEAPLARLYREAPLNSLWEGSGNVICLDVLRALARSPESLDALRHMVANANDASLDAGFAEAASALRGDALPAEHAARFWVERLALLAQAALMIAEDDPDADRFRAARLAHTAGITLGALR